MPGKFPIQLQRSEMFIEVVKYKNPPKLQRSEMFIEVVIREMKKIDFQ